SLRMSFFFSSRRRHTRWVSDWSSDVCPSDLGRPARRSVPPRRRRRCTGSLTFVQALRNGVGGVVGLTGARAVLVSPDGRHVYVASGGLPPGPAEHAIPGVARDPPTGRLTLLRTRRAGGDGVMGLFGVYAIAFAPGGATLYAASFGANALAVFGRDANTGVLDFRQVIFDGPADLGGAHAVAASPDGGHVYVAAFNEPAVTWVSPH